MPGMLSGPRTARYSRDSVVCPSRAGKAIAKALHMDYAFLCEFEELRSPLRDVLSQVATDVVLSQMKGRGLCRIYQALRCAAAQYQDVRLGCACCVPVQHKGALLQQSVRTDQGGGVHGNAILSRYSLSSVRVVQHGYAADALMEPASAAKTLFFGC